MRKSLTFVCALLLAGSAVAGNTIRFGSRVIAVGDTAAELYDVVGQPDHSEPIENEFGARVGERLQYLRDGKTVTFVIEDGKVARIEERR